MLKITPISKSEYVIHSSKQPDTQPLGQFLQEVDGFFVFYPNPNKTGFYSEELLAQLAGTLGALNEGWRAHLNTYFDKKS